jgi:hypothetical protein
MSLVYFQLAHQEDIQLFRDYDYSHSLCKNLARKIKEHLGIDLTREERHAQFEVLRLSAGKGGATRDSCDADAGRGQFLVRWSRFSIAGDVRLRITNVHVLPSTTCYMRGVSGKRLSGRRPERGGSYFVFYDEADRKSFEVGYKTAGQYANFGRRYLRSPVSLRFLHAPYAVKTADDLEDIAEQYTDDVLELLRASEVVTADEVQRKQYRRAVIQLYFALEALADVLALPAFANWQANDFAELTDLNPDYIMDEFLCKLLAKLRPEDQLAGWIRFAGDVEAGPRVATTEVMICTAFTRLVEDQTCDLSGEKDGATQRKEDFE